MISAVILLTDELMEQCFGVADDACKDLADPNCPQITIQLSFLDFSSDFGNRVLTKQCLGSCKKCCREGLCSSILHTCQYSLHFLDFSCEFLNSSVEWSNSVSMSTNVHAQTRLIQIAPKLQINPVFLISVQTLATDVPMEQSSATKV
jgi:hypothetical protein